MYKNEEFLHRVKEERNVLHTIKYRNGSSTGYILRSNYLLIHNIEGKIEEKIKGTGEDQEEDVSSYCMTLRKLEYTVS